MSDREDVCVLLPTLDEAETIGAVIDGFHEQGLENVFVMDGGSTDGTRDIAESKGARVRVQTGTGKGQAVREALDYIDAEYVLMADGDGTYRPEDAEAMLEPLFSGRFQHVIGDRFADMERGAMTRLNKVGNRIINRAFGVIHGRDFGDILSGYRAFTLESTRHLHLEADGFGVETEMAVECVKHEIPTTVVPIRYEARPGDSETNLNPLTDGGTIILTLYKLAKTNNPLFYFGSVGVASTLFGVILATYVGLEWVLYNISHEVMAFVAGVAVLFGVQLLIFGVLSDMIVTLHREQMRRIDLVSERVARERQSGRGPDEGGADDGEREAVGPIENGND